MDLPGAMNVIFCNVLQLSLEEFRKIVVRCNMIKEPEQSWWVYTDSKPNNVFEFAKKCKLRVIFEDWKQMRDVC